MNKTFILKTEPAFISATKTRDELLTELARVDEQIAAIDARAAIKAAPPSALDRAMTLMRGESVATDTAGTKRMELLTRKGLLIDGLAEADGAVRAVIAAASADQWRARAGQYIGALDRVIAAHQAMVDATKPFGALMEEMSAMGLDPNPACALPLGGVPACPVDAQLHLKQVKVLTELREEINAACFDDVGALKVMARILCDHAGHAPGAKVRMNLREATALRRAGRIEMIEG